MIDYLLRLKMYWGRASGHLGLPLAMFEKVAVLTILLKMFNINNWYITGIALLFMSVGMVLIGWLDVRCGIYDREQSLNNRYNPELQTLVRRNK